MRTGADTLNICGFSIQDTQRSRAPLAMTMGWFYIRVLADIPKPTIQLMADQYQIRFRSTDMIQIGWFKKFLDESQTAFMRSTNYFSLFSVRQFDKPDFGKTKNENKLLVIATDDWTPNPPAILQGKGTPGYFYVTNDTAEHIYEDIRVCKVEPAPVARPL